MNFELRDYQQECLNNINSDIQDGFRKLLVQGCTSFGKTILFSKLAGDLVNNQGKQALILAHREELISQAIAKYQRVNGLSHRIGVEMSTDNSTGQENVIVASVPTIGRKESKRIQKFNPKNFGLIITDETHHCSASTYQNVYDYFLNNNSDIVHLGVTATPVRTDGFDVASLFEKVSYKIGLMELIRRGFIANVRGYTVKTDVSLDGIKSQAGDFSISELSERINTDSRNQQIYEAYVAYCKGLSTVIFCADVAHAEEIRDVFKDQNIKAETINCYTPKDERRYILEAFERGEIKVITNMGVLTEGWDSFRVGAIIMARPTKSSLLYTQIIGRGVRKDKKIAPWKDECIVVDVVDVLKGMKQKTIATEAGAMVAIDTNGQTLTELDEIFEEAQARGININTKVSIDEIKAKFIEKSLIPEFEYVDNQLSEYKWFAMNTPSGQENVIQLPDGGTMILKENALRQYDISYKRGKNIYQVADSIRFYDRALEAADHYIKYNFDITTEKGQNILNFLKQTQKWHGRPASPKQKDFMKKIGIEFDDSITMGEASKLIDIKLAGRNTK